MAASLRALAAARRCSRVSSGLGWPSSSEDSSSDDSSSSSSSSSEGSGLDSCGRGGLAGGVLGGRGGVGARGMRCLERYGGYVL